MGMSSGHAARPASRKRAYDAEEHGRGQAHLDAEGAAHGKRHDRDGHGGSVHVDGGAKRNADGIEVGVEPETPAHGHVDGYVGSRAAREECADGTLLQAGPYDGIRVSAQIDGYDQRVEHKRRREHAAHEQGKQLAVGGEDVKSALRHRAEYQAHDAEGRKLYDPPDHVAHHVGKVAHHVDGMLAGLELKSQTDDDRPKQHADVVGVGHTQQWIAHHVLRHAREHVEEASGRTALGSVAQSYLHRKHVARHHSRHGGQQCRGKIERDHRAEPWPESSSGL